MSRPIPEGVEPPRPNTVIQGWGGDFIVPAEGFSGWMSSDNGLSWLEEDGLRGCDPDSLYAAPYLSDVNILNAPSLETSLGLAPGSFGKFIIKGMEEKAIRESEEYFSNLRTKINEAAERVSEVARLNQPMTEQEGCEILDELVESKFTSTDKDALIRELVKAGTFLRQDLEIELTDRGKGLDKWCSLLEWESALTLARTTCPEAFE